MRAFAATEEAMKRLGTFGGGGWHGWTWKWCGDERRPHWRVTGEAAKLRHHRIERWLPHTQYEVRRWPVISN